MCDENCVPFDQHPRLPSPGPRKIAPSSAGEGLPAGPAVAAPRGTSPWAALPAAAAGGGSAVALSDVGVAVYGQTQTSFHNVTALEFHLVSPQACWFCHVLGHTPLSEECENSVKIMRALWQRAFEKWWGAVRCRAVPCGPGAGADRGSLPTSWLRRRGSRARETLTRCWWPGWATDWGVTEVSDSIL